MLSSEQPGAWNVKYYMLEAVCQREISQPPFQLSLLSEM
jgi:hypothetical protein